MTTQAIIQSKLREGLDPVHLEVVNESPMHNVPSGSESHFKVTVVAEQFEGKMLVTRHRLVNELLAEELAGPVHALAPHTLTPDECLEASGQSADSSPCMGGSKADG